MVNPQTRTARWRSRAALAVVALILAAPSLWLMRTVPPLWRDIDAYIQTTSRPGPTTILLHGPLYAFVARVPLYAGYVVENVDAEKRPLGEFLLKPSLTDSGVLLLLWLQHAALIAAELWFLATLTRRAWARLLLAICMAANPLLYTFAHCVGSETLSAIGMIVLVTLGLRIMRSDESRRGDWIAYAAVLALLMLTRQINAGLAALLPLALLPLLARHAPPRAALRTWISSAGVRRFAIAAAIGVACFAVSLGAIRLIALAADITYRSKIGFTFMWRLQFLETLPPAERQRVIAAAAARSRSPETKAIIEALDELYAKPEPLDVVAFLREQRAELFVEGGPGIAVRTDHALNGMLLAFAIGSPSHLMTAAAADFVEARNTRIPDITDFLASSTAYYFGREQALPELGKLATFRHPDAAQRIAAAAKQPYLRWWNGLTFDGWLLVWLVAFASLLVMARLRRVETVAICSYATALVLTGLVMMLANCFLSELLPRYTLPMFQLAFLSLVLLLGRLAEIAATPRQLAAPPPR